MMTYSAVTEFDSVLDEVIAREAGDAALVEVVDRPGREVWIAQQMSRLDKRCMCNI